jgi:hypothetical protein
MATSTDNIVQEVSDTQNTEKNQDDLLFFCWSRPAKPYNGH